MLIRTGGRIVDLFSNVGGQPRPRRWRASLIGSVAIAPSDHRRRYRECPMTGRNRTGADASEPMGAIVSWIMPSRNASSIEFPAAKAW